MLRSSTTPALRPLFHASVFFPRTQRLALSTIHGRFAKSPYPPLPLKSQPQHNHRSTTVTTFITPAPISAVQSINNISSMYFASNAVYEEKTEEKEEKASTPSKPDTPPRSMLPFYDRVEKIWHVHGSHIDSHVVSFECPVCFIKDDGEGTQYIKKRGG